MSVLKPFVLSIALTVAALPALAASSASSASSEGSSASVGSLSGSIQTSSDSSSKTVVAEGPYKVIDVAVVPDRPGLTRVTLQAVAGEHEFVLLLPPPAAEQARLVAGDVVQVRARGYGLQFARADAREPFFLVLDDAAYRELQARPVTL
jgi:hypothetical protein